MVREPRARVRLEAPSDHKTKAKLQDATASPVPNLAERQRQQFHDPTAGNVITNCC